MPSTGPITVLKSNHVRQVTKLLGSSSWLGWMNWTGAEAARNGLDLAPLPFTSGVDLPLPNANVPYPAIGDNTVANIWEFPLHATPVTNVGLIRKTFRPIWMKGRWPGRKAG